MNDPTPSDMTPSNTAALNEQHAPQWGELTVSSYQRFEEIDEHLFAERLSGLVSKRAELRPLLKVISESNSEILDTDTLCQVANIPSITDLTVHLALLSESLCELLNITPVPSCSNKDCYLELIITSGPDYDFEKKGITLTLNAYLFNVIQQLRAEVINGY